MKLHRALSACALFALLLAPAASFAAAPDPRVTTLVKQSGASLHVSAMRSAHVVRLRGKMTTLGLTGTAEKWNEIGGVRNATFFSTPPLGGGNGWDGASTWNLDQTGLVIVDASDSGRAAAISAAFLSNYDLWKPNFGGATVSWAGPKTDKGHDYDVLTVSVSGSKLPFDVWFDRVTHLPARMVQANGPVISTTTFAQYHSIGGVLIPFAVNEADTNGNGSEFTATSADVDPAGAQGRLGKPNSTPHDFAIAGGTPSTTVSMRLIDDHVYLDVMLNGKGPYNLLFDTGGENIVDPDVAKEIGATGGGSMQIGGVGSATQSASMVTITSLQVGGATVSNQVFQALPVRKLFTLTTGSPIDGLIGYEVLSRFITTFDYANKTVTFNMPGTYTAPAGADVVSIAQSGTIPQFACGLNGVPATCTLDIGSNNALSFFGPFFKANPGVVPNKITALGFDGYGAGGPSQGRLGRLQSLSIGTSTLPNLIADYPEATDGSFALPFLGANVGGGVWKRFTLTLDYTALTMTLTPNADLNSPDRGDNSGLALLDPGQITVVDARPGTPAARAGLVKGEVITSVNGSSALSLHDIRDVLRGAPGTVVHLTVKKKDGSTQNVDLTLAEYV